MEVVAPVYSEPILILLLLELLFWRLISCILVCFDILSYLMYAMYAKRLGWSLLGILIPVLYLGPSLHHDTFTGYQMR